MDLQDSLHNAMKARRAEVLSKSDQLTLGELILKLEPIAAKQTGAKEAIIIYDLGRFPNKLDSWRGSYDELALNIVAYDGDKQPMKISAFLTMLKDAIGKTFTGYKGGRFVMNKHTPIWVANYGESGETAVIDVAEDSCAVRLITGIREF
jgi:hypothetical protein